MTSQVSGEGRDDNLNDSWVEFSDVSSGDNGASSLCKPPPSSASSSVIRLLLEAQKESSVISPGVSGQGSPSSCHSTVGSEVIDGLSLIDKNLGESSWVQQWSSRPEIIPTSRTMHDDGMHCLPPRRHWLSIRNTNVMRGVSFIAEHFQVLLVSHACSFLLGAVTMAIYMKKHAGRLSTVASPALLTISG